MRKFYRPVINAEYFNVEQFSKVFKTILFDYNQKILVLIKNNNDGIVFNFDDLDNSIIDSIQENIKLFRFVKSNHLLTNKKPLTEKEQYILNLFNSELDEYLNNLIKNYKSYIKERG